MLEEFEKWISSYWESASLIAVGAFLYATIRYRHLYEERKPQSFIVWVVDFFVAASSGIIFAATASALGLEGKQIMAIGGIGGYMGPRGMKAIGDSVTKVIESKIK